MSDENNKIEIDNIIDWNLSGFIEEGLPRYRLCKKIDATTGSVVSIDLQQLFIAKTLSRTEIWKDVEYAEELTNLI